MTNAQAALIASASVHDVGERVLVRAERYKVWLDRLDRESNIQVSSKLVPDPHFGDPR